MVVIFRKVGVANEIYRIPCRESSDQGQELTGEAMEKLARLEDAEEKDRLGQWIPINERLPESHKEGEDE